MSWLDLFRPKPDPAPAEISARLASIETKAAQLPAIVGGVTSLSQGISRLEEAVGKVFSQLAVQIEGQSKLSTQLTQIERKVQELMSKAEDLRLAQTDIAREVGETKVFVKGIQDRLDSSLTRIEDLIKQDADDDELRKAVEEVLPGFRADVDSLDKIQHPDVAGDTGTPPPVVPPIEPPVSGDGTESAPSTDVTPS